MRECTVEAYLVKRVEELGGTAEKVAVLGARGFFDRLVVLPKGRVIFVECKRPRGGRFSQHQLQRHARYRALGAEVAAVKNLDEVDRLLA